MTRRRIALGLVGILLVLGTQVPAVASLFDALPTSAAVVALGNDYMLAAALAGLTLVVVVGLLLTDRSSVITNAAPPDVEVAMSLPTPGDDFEALRRRRRSFLPYVGRENREVASERLRRAAIHQLMRYGNMRRPEAEAAVERGDWTTDRHAAILLRADVPLEERIKAWPHAWIRARPWYSFAVTRAVVAVVAAGERERTTEKR